MPQTQKTTMTPTTRRARTLRSLRDEIRLQIHLASMELRDRWATLEPEIERTLHELETAGRNIGEDLLERVHELREALPRRKSDKPS